jgi:hypothetical protein
MNRAQNNIRRTCFDGEYLLQGNYLRLLFNDEPAEQNSFSLMITGGLTRPAFMLQ